VNSRVGGNHIKKKKKKKKADTCGFVSLSRKMQNGTVTSAV
jgi:hypothetical protein